MANKELPPEDVPFGQNNPWLRTKRPTVSDTELERKRRDEHINPDVSKEVPGPLLGIALENGYDLKKENFPIELVGSKYENVDSLKAVKVQIIEQDRVPHPAEGIKYEDGTKVSEDAILFLFDTFIAVDDTITEKPDKGDYVYVDYENRLTRSGPKYFGVKFKGSANAGKKEDKNQDRKQNVDLHNTTSPPTDGSPVPQTFGITPADVSQSTLTSRPNDNLDRFFPIPNVLANGIDYSESRPAPKQIVDAGNTFVMRYVPYGGTLKELTQPELTSLLNAGLSVGFVFQRFGDEFLAQEREVRQLGITLGDSFAAGVKIAQKALKGMNQLKIPNNIPIYFAIEAGGGQRAVSDSEIPNVKEYFRGCVSVLGLERVGMYGGGPSFQAVAQQGNLASYFWQAAGWTPRDPKVKKKPIYSFSNLLQYKIAQLAGQEVDFDILLKPNSGFLKR